MPIQASNQSRAFYHTRRKVLGHWSAPSLSEGVVCICVCRCSQHYHQSVHCGTDRRFEASELRRNHVEVNSLRNCNVSSVFDSIVNCWTNGRSFSWWLHFWCAQAKLVRSRECVAIHRDTTICYRLVCAKNNDQVSQQGVVWVPLSITTSERHRSSRMIIGSSQIGFGYGLNIGRICAIGSLAIKHKALEHSIRKLINMHTKKLIENIILTQWWWIERTLFIRYNYNTGLLVYVT